MNISFIPTWLYIVDKKLNGKSFLSSPNIKEEIVMYD